MKIIEKKCEARAGARVSTTRSEGCHFPPHVGKFWDGEKSINCFFCNDSIWDFSSE